VTFVVRMVGKTENHSSVEPLLLPRSPLSGLVARFRFLVGRSPHGSAFAFSISRFVSLLRRTRPDLAIVKHSAPASPLLELLCRLFSVPTLWYDERPLLVSPNGGGRGRRPRTRLRPRARITPVLGASGDVSEREPHAYYLPFLVDVREEARGRRYPDGGRVRIFSIGKFFSPRKNHLLLIEAVRRLRKEFPVELTIFGSLVREDDPTYRRILAAAEAPELRGAVRIEANVPYERCQLEYGRQDVFVLASAKESAAVSPLEAMAWGLPVVCTDTNGTRCYIEPGVNGEIVATNDVDALTAALRRILSEPGGIARMGRESLRLVEERHSLERGYEMLCAILEAEFPGRLAAWTAGVAPETSR
jgi:glycosyltransferase involved in cell wall biosynthesis